MCEHKKNSEWCHICKPINALYYAIIRRHNLYFHGRKNHYQMMNIKDRAFLYKYLLEKFNLEYPNLNMSTVLQNGSFEIDHLMPIGKKINGVIDITRCNHKNLSIISKSANRKKSCKNTMIALHLLPF